MARVAVGKKVPAFTQEATGDKKVALKDLAGKRVVIYFYPKDNTPGCTTEACTFRDLGTEFNALGAKVLGISADTVKRQSNFAAKHNLPMALLADTERTVLEAWGIWAEKKNYGRTYMGIVRSTFLFDADGRLVQKWEKVRVKGHVDAVLEAAGSGSRHIFNLGHGIERTTDPDQVARLVDHLRMRSEEVS